MTDEQAKLFEQVRMKLGAPIRDVELDDKQLCTCLELATGQYSSLMMNLMLDMVWPSIMGQSITGIDWAFALSTRSFNMQQDYSYYFSKEVGLQQRGPWELKKDFFKLEKGKQVYMVPAGRAINKVLWVTPPTTDAALWANFAGLGVGFGGGVVGQMGMGAASAFGGMSTHYGMGMGVWAVPAYDVSLMAADMSYKQSLFRGELTYKVTAGPDGTHLIHLISTPGSPFTFGVGGRNLLPLHGCTCWYTYYDVSDSSVSECAKANKDVLLTPDQIPLENLDYELMNAPTQNIVRQLMIGEAYEMLAIVRGKFSGQINMMANQLQMDYNMLLTLGQREKDNANKLLEERVNRLSPYTVMENQAKLVENMINIKKGTPLGIYVI